MATQTALKAQLSESARALAAQREAEQLDLLPAVRRIDVSNEAEVGAFGAEQRKRGRPPGSQNHTSLQLRALVEGASGGNLMLQSARWLGLEPEEMAHRLGISKAEAFDRQEAIRERLRPYLYGRLAPVDEKGKAVTPIAMFIGGQTARADELPPWHRAFETLDGELVEIQGLSGAASGSDGAKSHAGKSHGA